MAKAFKLLPRVIVFKRLRSLQAQLKNAALQKRWTFLHTDAYLQARAGTDIYTTICSNIKRSAELIPGKYLPNRTVAKDL